MYEICASGNRASTDATCEPIDKFQRGFPTRRAAPRRRRTNLNGDGAGLGPEHRDHAVQPTARELCHASVLAQVSLAAESTVARDESCETIRGSRFAVRALASRPTYPSRNSALRRARSWDCRRCRTPAPRVARPEVSSGFDSRDLPCTASPPAAESRPPSEGKRALGRISAESPRPNLSRISPESRRNSRRRCPFGGSGTDRPARGPLSRSRTVHDRFAGPAGERPSRAPTSSPLRARQSSSLRPSSSTRNQPSNADRFEASPTCSYLPVQCEPSFRLLVGQPSPDCVLVAQGVVGRG